MRLQRLHLQNFRQHVDTKISFRPGVTGVIGPNGAGKSTILEAIAWAIYGASAARGRNDTIRFSRAAPRARVTVDLTFELDSHEYRVTRTLTTADVYLDNEVNPVATGVSVATAYLQNKLGMSLQEFFNTYFTGQKELQFLAQMGPADRGRFLAQVLGYERLRKAQNIAKDKRRALSAEIDGLKSALPDPHQLKAERVAAEQRLKDAKKQLARAEKDKDKLEQEAAVALPVWNALQEAKDRAHRLTVQIDSLKREAEGATRDVLRAEAELLKIDAAEKDLGALKPQLEELTTLAAEAEQLEELSRAHARRSVLQQNEQRLVVEIAKLVAALDGLQHAPVLLQKAQAELAELKKALPEAEQLREGLSAQYQKDAQDNRTELRILLTQAQELEDQISKLEAAGETGNCPICTKPLGDEFTTVREHLQLELEDRRNIIKWRQSREKQLSKKPEPLLEAERILAQLMNSLEKKTEREAKCQKGIEELWKATEDKQARDKQLAEVREELAAVADGYDAARHAHVRQRVGELQKLAAHARVFEHEIAARGTREADLIAARTRHAKVAQELQSAAAGLAEIGFDEQRYARERESYEKLLGAAQAARISFVEASQLLLGVEEALATAKRAESVYEEKRTRLAGLGSELRHHTEMDTAVTQLRTELNARVRPELAEMASSFLADITDGRYNALEIDESYNVMVLEDGEEKPVISGGEEDVANLVLRIAISQMIAERANQHLSTLFLDEVFGSLDVERRDNVIQLLLKLHDHFEQVVLITHVETVREGLDHVIRLEYDERTGASVVKEDVITEDAQILV